MTSNNTRSNWTMIGLVLSCLINVLLGGVLAGMVTGRFLPPMIQMRPPHLSVDVAQTLMNRLTAGLVENDQQIIQNAFRVREADLAETINAARHAKAKVQEALQAEPFDGPQFEVALQNLDSKMAALPRLFQSLMKEVAPSLSSDSRWKLGERFNNMPPL